ncbi:MAG: hypothetical protein HYZ14_05295 [Bacteroidetes bacterium]|nr:hypothetical protein [Bacteroidota bacterium]
MKNSARKTGLKSGENHEQFIRYELEKLKQLKKRMGEKLTVAGLKTMKGFESLSDDTAAEVLKQMEEYVTIVLMQMSRLKLL